jgi:O-antigen ligase
VRSLVVILLLGGVLVRGAYLVQERLGFRAVDRIVALRDLRADASTEVHVEGARGAWEEFLDHPAFGSGLDESRTGEYPHNVVIESFMATGVLGGAAFSIILLCSSVAAAKLMTTNATRWISLLYVQYLVSALVSGALYLSGTMWCFIAAVIGLAAARQRDVMLTSPLRLRAPPPLPLSASKDS